MANSFINPGNAGPGSNLVPPVPTAPTAAPLSPAAANPTNHSFEDVPVDVLAGAVIDEELHRLGRVRDPHLFLVQLHRERLTV